MTDMLVTVIVPTFDHVDTLRLSVPTALAQTHANIEVFAVGDGAPNSTRSILADLACDDARLQYVEFPKGERNGELHRHEILTSHARGSIVTYLSDDDLWLPDHLETVLDTMFSTGANFVSCQPVWICPDPTPDRRWIVDLSLGWYREQLAAGRNRIPLSCGTHSMKLYRSLPHGWRVTPRGIPTDLYMWQQLLAHPDCIAASTPHTTVIGLPDSQRAEMSVQERFAELAAWTPTSDPVVRERFLKLVQSAPGGGLLDHARLEVALEMTDASATAIADERDADRATCADLQEQLADATGRIADLEQHVQASMAEIERLALECDTLDAAHLALDTAHRSRIAELEHELRTIFESRGWRTLERIRGVLR